eukprot:gene7796-7993_t
MALDAFVLQTVDFGLRSLLHVRSAPTPAEPEHAHEHLGETEAEHAAHAAEQGTLDLRIAAIFVIWFGAVLFGVPTLIFKQFESLDAPIPRLLRSFAGGIIMALALVHIIPEAVSELNSLMEFPIGGCTVLFGIIALVLLDSWLASSLAPDHSCMRSLNSTSWVASAAAPVRNIKQYVTAYTMELGCIFHSVIIGVGVGVITEDRHLVITLMVALAVHQGLEALALGSVLALTGFHALKKVAMLLLYSITTPIGIAVGIAVSASYDPESNTSKAVQGTLNGVSGGMLLYIGMYQLIAEEFSREDLLVKPRLRLGMYTALCLGAAAMCILGIWA